MAGGKFFALVDELEASERRLDEAAEPLLKAMQDTEAEAKRAIDGRMAKLDAARDYIKRMHATAEKLNEGNGNNGGPTVTSQSSQGPGA